MKQPETPIVGLFATCLVDLYRPTVGFATAALLEQAGCSVEVPPRQICCGQPAYNSGNRRAAEAIARQTIALFEPVDYVVVPSGSCAGMLKCHYPDLLAGDEAWADRAVRFAEKCWELTSFLVDVRRWTPDGVSWQGAAAYHDSCSSLRECDVSDQPRALLANVRGADVRELDSADVCCGFGGTFCVKYPEVSVAMVDRKVDDIAATGADTVLAGDLGCLMNISGRLSRRGLDIRARHVAEVLAGMADGPAIGYGPGGHRSGDG